MINNKLVNILFLYVYYNFSGSGKTTLLASISMRVQGELTGSILFNGQKMSRQFLSSISGFVPQQDLDFDLLTVHEHMEFMVLYFILIIVIIFI